MLVLKFLIYLLISSVLIKLFGINFHYACLKIMAWRFYCMCYFFGVVFSLLSCRTHQFSLNIFQMAVYIIVLRDRVPVGLLVVEDPQLWPIVS
jgi:predicted ferric reductase